MSPPSDLKRVQADLIVLGYLPKGADDGVWGKGSKRALIRFQRRARTHYRVSSLDGSTADCDSADTPFGAPSGEVDTATLEDIRRWILRKWKAPLGRFGFKAIPGGILREDVAEEWLKLSTKIKGLGGTLDGPFGDTKRAIGKAKKDGASSFSFHTVGRAVDLQQALAGGRGQRYYIAKDARSDGQYWRIYCKSDKQDGSQGKKYEKDIVACWSFWDKKAFKLPAGHYIDLTAEIESGGKFERIRAHEGWESNTNRSEWWHFQYALDKQTTFQDECELVGITEKQLRDAGYGDADLDRRPG
ncbi:MAG: peptidoglycan-binding domain-containing protein [Gemmatimonadaceae bacterium]|nr:peptidoglycan-binding domain-containing protein [Gemmatimonadaceae bacterium]